MVASFIGLGVFIVIMIVIAIAQKKGTNKLKGKGLVVDRPKKYFEKKNNFATSTTFEQLKSEISKGNLEPTGMGMKCSVVEGGNAFVFQLSNCWSAVLEDTGEVNGRNTYSFYFANWRAKYGNPYGENQMNMLLTSIEKMFLSLDPATTVETHEMNLKRK